MIVKAPWLERLHEPRRTATDVVISHARIELMGHRPVAGTGDLHVTAAKAPGTLLGRVHQRSSDSLPASPVIDHEGNQATPPGRVLKQRKRMHRRHARDHAARLSHHQHALRILKPVLQPGSHIHRLCWIPQLIKQHGNPGRVLDTRRSDHDRHDRQSGTQRQPGSRPRSCRPRHQDRYRRFAITCPFRPLSAWQDMRRDQRDLFTRGCHLEATINRRRHILRQDPVYLTLYNALLADVSPDADTLAFDGGDGACDTGWCFT